MPRPCPLCGENYSKLLTEHVEKNHPVVVGHRPSFLGDYTVLVCFCGFPCKTYQDLAKHWRLRGGVANHILAEKLG